MYRLILGLCLQDKAVAQESRQKRLFHHCKQAIKNFFSQYTVSRLCVSPCVCVHICVYSCVSFIIVWSNCPPPRCDPSDQHTPVPLWSHTSPPAPSSHWPALLHTQVTHVGVMLYVTFGVLSMACVAAGDLSPVMLTLHCSGKIEFARFPHCKVTLTPFP